MCSMGKIAACMISFIPVQSESYLSDVNKVLDIIKASGLRHAVGGFATELYGEAGEICSLITKIYEEMDNSCSFVLDVRFSNVCGGC